MRLLIANLILAIASSAGPLQSPGDTGPRAAEQLARYDIVVNPSSIVLIDLSDDQRPEMVVLNRYSDCLSVFLNNGNGGFSLKSRRFTGIAPVAIATSDFNRDGHPDIAVVNLGSNSVSVYFGSGDGSFARRDDYQTGAVPCAIAIGDLNHDNNPDLVIVNRYSSSASVFLGSPNGKFADRVDYDAGRLPYSVAISDINRDGKPDILVTSCFDRTVSLLPGYGDGRLQPRSVYAKAAGTCCTVIGDVDGDGRPDFAEAHRFGYLISVQLGSAAGDNDAGRSSYIGGKGPRGILAADFNGDGIADIAVANSGHNIAESGSVSILLGRRNGSFEPKATSATGSGSYALAAADLNGDGKLDLAVANGTFDYGGSVSVLFGNGDGTFSGRTDYATGAFIVWIPVTEDNLDPLDRGVKWTERPDPKP